MKHEIMTIEAAEEHQREQLNAIAADRARKRCARIDAARRQAIAAERQRETEARKTIGLCLTLCAWLCANIAIFSAIFAPWWTVPIPMLATVWCAARAVGKNR